MVERVIGYREIEKEEVIFRPVKWHGDAKGDFSDMKPVKVIRRVFTPIFEDLGPARIDNNMISQFEFDQQKLYQPKGPK